MSKVKCYIVSYTIKVAEDWARVEKVFHSRDEVMDYITDNKRNKFNITVVKEDNNE